MKFCPLCFKLLLIQNSATGNCLMCKICRYHYPLSKAHRHTIQYATHSRLEVVQQGQETKELPVAEMLCEKCGGGRAYYEQRQTRSADEAATIFYTCVQCGNKWNDSS